ncbi:unnamed protein product [Ilex paraguariensis]|uniref:Vacuolar sorting receptor thioredoxin-like domain-containing protein n=1 Tax=Ilex paraguariensis TaxID=185542 RepID=A0ABC8RP80_9AQUA
MNLESGTPSPNNSNNWQEPRHGIDLKQVDKCIGDPKADVDNPVLKAEQEAQVSKGSRGDLIILPILVVNNRQYIGKRDKGAVLKAIC